MRKYFLSFVALAAMLFATSCQESIVEPQVAGPTTFTVQLPDAMGTKAAIGSANTVNQLFVSVYAPGCSSTPLSSAVVEKTEGDGTFTVSFNLIQDQTYDLIFWAQTTDAYVEKSTTVDATYDLRTIDIADRFYSSENGAAFYAYQTYEIDGQPKEATLRRPFAQLNIGTTVESLKTDADSDIILEGAKIEVKNVASSFNTVTGFGEGDGNTIYGQPSGFVKVAGEDIQVNNNQKYAKLEVGGKSYVYVTMDYLPIISSETVPKDLVEIKLLIDTDQPTAIEHTFSSVPVQRNYRTNIVGNLISSTTDFNVVVDADFAKDANGNLLPDNDYFVVDNVAAAKDAFDNGKTHVAINNVGNNNTLELPSTATKLYLQLPDADATFTIKRSQGDFEVRIPNTNPSNSGLDLIIDAPNSTVKVVNSQLRTINGKTAQNTLILSGVIVEEVIVEQGNVVVENDSAVGGIAPGEGVDASKITIYVDDSSADGTEAVDDRFTVIEEEEDGDIKFITSASKLQQLAELVNGGNNFAGQTITLLADIDLNNVEWTPIGKESKPFSGTFDGNNHTISNLVVEGGSSSDQGLFGLTTNGEIKNLIVNNAKVSGRLNVGVVAGNPYTSKYTKIRVTGHVEVNGMAYVGGVAGKNAYANWTDITVAVDETSFVYANSVENGTAYRTYVGGVVGFNGEGGHSFTDITSNIDVKGSTCDVGGLFGIAHYGNNFVNCSSSGDVEIYAADNIDSAEEIGGIAGVWHNADGQTVTFTNCQFTGNLKTNVEGVDLLDNKITGKAYNKEGNGKLIINGITTTLVNSLEELNAAIKDGYNVIITNNIAVANSEAGSNGYGATGISQLNGGVIDGNGNNISVTAWGTWDSAINTTGGTIKNLNVTGGMRGIFVNHNSPNCGKVILENVTIDGTVYTISCDQGTNNGLEAYNSTFNGWTSYAATIGNVKFVDCSFGEGQGYSFCRPYAPTEFVNCAFEAGYVLDARAAVTFENCTIGGVALTAENLATLVSGGIANATVK